MSLAARLARVAAWTERLEVGEPVGAAERERADVVDLVACAEGDRARTQGDCEHIGSSTNARVRMAQR